MTGSDLQSADHLLHNILAAQAGHQSHINNQIYAVEDSYPLRLLPSRQEAFQRASAQWHSFILSPVIPRGIPEVTVPPWLAAAPSSQSLRLKTSERGFLGFEPLPQLKVIVCRRCQYAVRPAEVERHLTHQHYMTHRVATPIVQAIRQLSDIEQDSLAIQVPLVLDDPLPIIPCHSNGLPCQRAPDQCTFCRRQHAHHATPLAGRSPMVPVSTWGTI
ncbi:hypothetical protein BBP40_010066 [Aspergillus hancockii]|nr:hypothetical protein BBP40_010066 [Aspergillus hancockii]